MSEYHFEEYPKLPSKIVDGKVCHLVFPEGHEHQGETVVYHDAEDEVRLEGIGVVPETVLVATTVHAGEAPKEYRDHSRQPHAMPSGMRGETKLRVGR